jgi:hypothetical protein
VHLTATQRRKEKAMVLRQETQLATPEQQGPTIYASIKYYSQLPEIIDVSITIGWDTSY